MGWWKNKTNLEALMLVVSECGEAANECRGEAVTDNFGTELADIVLRVLGIAAENDINLVEEIDYKMEKNKDLKPNKKRVK
jgi:NTP pyrophosphatase (non-canonical NTP hydrolase)